MGPPALRKANIVVVGQADFTNKEGRHVLRRPLARRLIYADNSGMWAPMQCGNENNYKSQIR